MAVLLGSSLFAVFGWHLVLWAQMEQNLYSPSRLPSFVTLRSASVNPVIDTVQLSVNIDESNTSPEYRSFAAVGEALGAKIGETAIQEELRKRSREYFDVYAMILPYDVRYEVLPSASIEEHPNEYLPTIEATPAVTGAVVQRPDDDMQVICSYAHKVFLNRNEHTPLDRVLQVANERDWPNCQGASAPHGSRCNEQMRKSATDIAAKIYALPVVLDWGAFKRLDSACTGYE